MKNRRKYLLLGIFLLQVISLLAQGNKAHTNPSIQILQPSSEAQSLGNFAEIPVDLYTGRTNINIPLLTISHNDIEVPISISYHGGGIKVDDECGSVGLGWTLNATGVVNRIVRGMPDELLTNNGVAGYARLKDLQCIGSNNKYSTFLDAMKQCTSGSDPMAILHNSSASELSRLDLMSEYGKLYDEGHFDSAPDNFIFSVLGLSGAFVNNKIQDKQSDMGCSILQTNNGFQITDANGFKYVLNQHEKQYYPYKVSNDLWLDNWDDLEQLKSLYISAWWLNSIQSKAGDSITFSYQTIRKRHKFPDTFAYTQYEYRTSNNDFDYDCNFIKPHNYFMDTVHHEHILLTSINTPNSRVVFHYTTGTSDIDAVGLVDSISVYAYNANGGNLIERYKFTYSGIGNRSKLISLVRQGKNNRTQRYDFTYYSSWASIGKNAKDHWGYYSQSSKGTFPDMDYLNITPRKIPRNQSATRNADHAYANNNMLASITYPSGLLTRLTWEPHDYSKWSCVGQRAYSEHYTENSTIYDTIVRNNLELCGKASLEVLSQTWFLQSNQYIDVDISHYFYTSDVESVMGCVMSWSQECSTCNPPKFSILYSGNEIFYTYLDSLCVRPNYIRNRIKELVYYHGSGNYTFKLSNPRTTLLSETTNNCVHYHEMFNKPETKLGKIPITIYEVLKNENPVNEEHVGGVRIKQIEYVQGYNLLLRKEYFYKDSLGNSTGVLAYPPRYASAYPMGIHTVIANEDGTGATATSYDEPQLLVLRSNGLPFTLNSGGHIEYEQVTEMITSEKNKPMNRIDYFYRTSSMAGCSDIDDTNYGILMPTDMIQLTSQKHHRGHLIKKVEYSDEYRTTEYTYRIIEKSQNEIHTGALFPIADFQKYTYKNASYKPYKNFGIVKYRVIPYNKRLVSQKTIGEKTNTYHAYTYANDSYSTALNANMPLTHTYTTSEGDTFVEHFTYLPNTNKISQCVTTKQGYVVEAYKLEYDNAYRVIKKFAPLLLPTSLPSIANITWELVETYNYDTAINKIVEVINHKTNLVTTYLWSYGGQYPIAEIANATLATVKEKLNETCIEQLQQSYDPDLSVVNNLRVQMPSTSINTMTYEPLVGMTSFTDAKGYTQYYTYDDFGQLQEVYEMISNKKNVLKYFDYQTKNQ